LLSLTITASAAHAKHVFRAVQDAAEVIIISTSSAAGDDESPSSGSLNSRITVPEYTPDDCSAWLATLLDADADGSGGLSSDEFHDFLMGIDDPPYVTEFFDQHDSYVNLPWMFKVVHMSLACRCKDLGMGDGCCTGPNAEVPIAVMEKTSRQGMTEAQTSIANEYQADLCNSVAASFEEVIEEPNPTASPVESLVVVTTAATAAATTTTVASEVEDEGTTATVAATTTKEPVVIVPAPTEPADPIVPGKGIVMDVVGSVLDYSAFDFSGIFVGNEEGIPDFFNAADIMGNTDENNVLGQVIEAFNELALAWKDVALPDITEERKRRGLRSNKQREGGARKLAGIGTLLPVLVTDISCPSGLTYAPNGAYCLNFKFIIENNIATDLTPLGEMLEDVINDEGGLYDVVKANNPDSALTGMGSPGRGIDYLTQDAPVLVIQSAEAAASTGLGSAAIAFIILAIVLLPMATVAMYTRYRKVQDEEARERVASYHARTKAQQSDLEAPPVVASRVIVELIPDGVPEDDSILSDDEMIDTNKKATAIKRTESDDSADSKAEIRKEVRFLVGETNAPKTADELMAAYEGRELELLGHLQKMHTKQNEVDNDELKTEIRGLVAVTNPGKTADELLAAYGGREEELAGNLRKMKGKQYKNEIESLVAATSPGKTTEELLEAYEGREEDLIKNLTKMKTKQDKGEVASLVELTQPGKSTNELLAAYEGREDELIKNLKKMKSKKDIAEVEVLVASTNVDKSAKDMLEAYEGREDELVKNLKKMKSKQDIEEVKSLVASTNPGKSAEEMLEAFEGREDELIKNLRKMKTKQDKTEIKSLVESTNPGKSAKDLMSAYEGREDELIKNLTKMKEVQEKKDASTTIVADATPPSPTKKEESEAIKAEVMDLVASTNPGKSAEELLGAYEGREGELVTHLKKLQKSKSKRG